MIRFVLRSECSYTQEKYKIEIFDSNYTGDPTYYTGAGSVFTLTHQQINPQEPYRQNIQQGQCTVSLHNDDSNFLSDLFDSQEGDMFIKIYKYPLSFASTHSENIYDEFIQIDDFSLLSDCDSGRVDELDAFTWIDDLTTGDSIYWQGYIFPDLCTYEESFDPYVLNLVAKDFLYTKRELYGSDVGFTFGRKSLFEVIYTILRDEFEIPFRSITGFAADDSGEDYLEQVYIDDSTLREYEQTGIGLIPKIEALQRILQSNNLMVKQTDGKWFVTQLSAMDNIVDVLEAVDTSTATLDTSVNIGQSQTKIITQSSVGVVNPVGIIQGRYLHRTRISTINVPGTVSIDQSTASRSYTSDITTDTDSHTITIVGQIAANTGATNTPLVKGYILIKYGTDYWDGTSWTTYSSGNGVPIELDQSSPFSSIYTGTVSIQTDFIPSGSEELSITLYRAEEFDSGGSLDEYALLTTYNLSVSVDDIDADKNNESQKIFASSGNFYTYEYDLADIYFGDAIVEFQKSKYTFTDGSNTSSWAYKGDTRNLSFIELVTEDILGFLNKPKRYLRAIIREDFEPYKVLSYDGSYWVYLGGTLNGKTGEWQVLLVESGKADPNATIDITDEFSANDITRDLYGKTQLLLPDGQLPERDIDRSDILTQTVTSEVFQISGDQNTTAVNVILSSQENFTLTSLDIANAEDGQEILLWINPSPSSKSLTIESTPSSAEPIIVPNGSIVRRLSSRSIFRFKRLTSNSQAYWNLIYEVSLPPTEEEPPTEEDQVATPTFSPAPGTYTGDRDLVISCATSGATIKYSTDGSEPTTTYSGAVTLTTGNYTVRAIATKAGLTDSDEAVGQYTINAGAYDNVPDKPTFDPDGGLFYGNDVDVTITTNGEPGEAQTVYYTTDGTDPDTSSSVYSTALTFTETTTLKARAKYDSGTVLSDVTVATYSKAGLSVIYRAGWNLISIPFNYPVTENTVRQIFGNGKNTTYTYREGESVTNSTVSANLENAQLDAVNCQPGFGYWIKLPQGVEVNWSELSQNRYNLLSNDAPVAQRGTSIPYTWSGSNGSVALLPFNSVVDGEDYLRLTLLTQLASYSQKIYLDDIVTRNYAAMDYELSAKFSVDNAGSATIYLGIEEYNASKVSTGTDETAVTVTSTPQTITETFTSGISYYVRPYIKIVETSPQSGGLKLYIREQSFSADPGLLTSVSPRIDSDGWYLVGATSAITTVTTDGNIVLPFYGWTQIGDGTYELLQDVTKLKPGRGYYINFSGATGYTVDES